jgi:hypothetical protein
MLGMALVLSVYPGAIRSSSFHYIIATGISGRFLFWSFLLFGVIRGLALLANGWLPVYGPLARAVGAAGGAFLWANLGFSLFVFSYDTDVISVGVPVYIVLTELEVFSCYRAATDVRRRPA